MFKSSVREAAADSCIMRYASRAATTATDGRYSARPGKQSVRSPRRCTFLKFVFFFLSIVIVLRTVALHA